MPSAIQILLIIGVIVILIGIIKSAIKFTIIVAVVLIAIVLISRKIGYSDIPPMALMLQGML